jgi:two-component system phosphate regulon sensor histidine kinase PhoR
MARKRLLWQLYPSYLFIALIPMIAAVAYSIHELRDFYMSQVISDLEARARIFEGYLVEKSLDDTESIKAICKSRGEASSTRITVILSSGVVLGDSDKDSELMENHIDRPEVIKALGGKTGWNIRKSGTLDQNMMYVAIPLIKQKRIVGVVRTSIPVALFEKTLNKSYINIAFGGVLIAVFASVLCFLISRILSRPLEEMKQGISEFAKGDFSVKLPVPETEELGVLAEAANDMASELDDRIKTITQQRNEQNSILSSMIEGVLAVDKDERIVHLNLAAEKILGCHYQSVRGKLIQESLRRPDLLDFVKTTLEGHASIERDITWHDEEERFFQAKGATLKNAEGENVGAVVVLNEVTHLYKLERMRRDFVANVSHELRTPITSIRGFAETLLDSNISDIANTEKFLGIIVRQTNRLNSLIEDLLALSRIEKQTEQDEILLAPGNICDVLSDSIQTCEIQAIEKQISLVFQCKDDIKANIHKELLERAVTNLIDNAVKYSPAGTQITVRAVALDDVIRISVEDQGEGIAKEHLDRLFERFYRVDKARSRSIGGTGLGLSIVKHVSHAHGGSVSVDSSLGKGCIFTISIPRIP